MFKSNVTLIPPFNESVYTSTCEGSRVIASDYTIFMTMMALLLKRYPDFKFINRYCEHYPSSVPDTVNAARNTDAINFIWFNNCNKNPDEYLPEGYNKEFVNFERFLAEKLDQDIYIRTYDSRVVCIFATKLNLQVIHAAQVFIPVLIPKYFDECPRTEAETKLLVSLSQYTDAAYRKEIHNLIDDPKLKEILLHKSLFGFEKRLRTTKYKNAAQKAEDLLGEMERILEDYRQACCRRNEAVAYAEGLKVQMDAVEVDTEFEQYLAANKLLTDIDIQGDHLSFIVKTFVDPYLPDDWDSLSRRGYIYEGYRSTGSVLDDKANMKLLLDAIFSRNHSLKLRICAYFTMDVFGTSVSSIRDYDYVGQNPTLANYIPNGHLNTHNCFGQNRSDILVQMADGDMIGAVECCINVARRMNVAESASFAPFVESIKKCKGKCIMSEDGTEMTVAEAVNYLKGKQNEEVSD